MFSKYVVLQNFKTIFICIGLSYLLYFSSLFLIYQIPFLEHIKDESYLVYMPAGFKVVLILVYGWMGALGVFLAVFTKLMVYGPAQTLSSCFWIALTGTSVFYFTIKLILKVFGISNNLRNIQYKHIVLIALLTSLFNGFVYTYFMFIVFGFGFDNYARESFFVAISNFLGNMVVIFLIHFLVLKSKTLQNEIEKLPKLNQLE
jgi:hypothetical protein